MDIRIQAIHFDASEKLVSFINKKIERLARHNVNISDADVTLKVVKPETAMNKGSPHKGCSTAARRHSSHQDRRHIRRSHRSRHRSHRPSARQEKGEKNIIYTPARGALQRPSFHPVCSIDYEAFLF